MPRQSNNESIAILNTQVQNMSKEITEVKGYLQDIIVKVDRLALAMSEVNELRRELKDIKTELEEVKGVNNLKNTLLWVGLVASAIINVVVIYQLFGG